MATNSNARPAAARAFVRSLNILLKFARMYDFGHPRTVKQFETGWSELRTALGVPTFYNEALGSVSQVSVYDRVKGRKGDVPDETVGAHSDSDAH